MTITKLGSWTTWQDGDVLHGDGNTGSNLDNQFNNYYRPLSLSYFSDSINNNIDATFHRVGSLETIPAGTFSKFVTLRSRQYLRIKCTSAGTNGKDATWALHLVWNGDTAGSTELTLAPNTGLFNNVVTLNEERRSPLATADITLSISETKLAGSTLSVEMWTKNENSGTQTGASDMTTNFTGVGEAEPKIWGM